MFSDHRLRNLCAALITATVLGGCTGGSHIAATATDANLALERSTNEVLLLNIIRASKQRPMYFTGLSGVSMVSTISAAGGLSLPFGGDATNLFGFTPSFSAKVQPTSTIQILDNMEFMKAIHTPVSTDLFNLFLKFGWPKEFLLYMFVHRLRIKNSLGEQIVEYGRNIYKCPKEMNKGEDKKCLIFKAGKKSRDPKGPLVECTKIKKENELCFDVFGENIKKLAKNTRITSGEKKIILFGAPIPNGSEQHKRLMSQVLELQEKNLQIDNVCLLKSEIEKRKEVKEKKAEEAKKKELEKKARKDGKATFEIATVGIAATTISKDEIQEDENAKDEIAKDETDLIKKLRVIFPEIDKNCGKKGRGSGYILTSRPAPPQFLSYKVKKEANERNQTVSTGAEIKEIFLRSPQGMLYFLGQMARSYLEGDFGSGSKEPPKMWKDVPLFKVGKGAAIGDAAVSVTYDGETYSIPGGDKHASMMALSLISQVIALQKDPKSIPQPNIVNLFSN